MTLYFITGNANKFKEVSSVLPDIKQKYMDLPEIQSFSSEEIIREKLKEVKKKYNSFSNCHLEFIVEDTSLHLDCLGGFPGPFIKFFLEENLLEDIYSIAKDRSNFDAYAKTTIGYKGSKGIEYFEGIINGKIVKPRVESKFGWDPIFQPIGYSKTFGEMTLEEKNQISMRKIAAQKLKDYLRR